MKVFFILWLAISSSYASVWETTNNWNSQYIDELRAWMASDAVKPGLFTNPSSEYYGIKADCADVTYVLRAIFSKEHGLPFMVKNPHYRRGHSMKFFSNDMDKFDRYSSKQKFVQFANMLGDSLGTETLNANDSYPVALSKITSNDYHGYKISKRFGGDIRHSYNIKEVTDTGNFKLIWSTQQRKKEGRPMAMQEWSSLQHRPHKFQWGFRRMKFPGYYSLPTSAYEDYSTEQYALAKQMNDKQFFRHVKKLLKTRDEDPNVAVRRELENVCTQTKERVTIIAGGEAFRSSIGGKCMDYRQYDEYSTPARDGRLLLSYDKLIDLYNTYRESGELSQVNPDYLEIVEAIKKGDAHEYCQVTYMPGAEPMNLYEVYNGLKKEKFSSHPNDNIHRRWGVKSGRKTKCKTWY